MIKMGPYGKYYEWTDHGTICRVSIDEYDFTEEQCEKLVAGEKIDFKRKIGNSLNPGFIIGKATITSYQNKKGGTSYKIQETETQKYYDIDIITKAVKNGTLIFSGSTIKGIASAVTEQLKSVVTSIEYEVTYGWYHEVSKEEKIEFVGIYRYSSRGFNIKEYIYQVKYLTKNDEIIKELDEAEYEKYRKIANDYATALREKRAEEERIAKLEAERERIATILKTPWEEITLDDYKNNSYSDWEEIEQILSEKYPEKDISKLILFKIKKISYRENPGSRSSTRADQCYITYYIGDVLPGITPKHIEALKAFPIASSYVREYKWEHDDSVEYILDYTLHGTD